MANPNVLIRPEATPNPASMRFQVNRRLLAGGTADFPNAEAAVGRSPLAERLFQIDGVKAVFLGQDFVTITAEAEADWEVVTDQVGSAVRAHVESGEEALLGGVDAGLAGKSETEQGIIRVIEEEIRPAVAMDGGDVIFGGYENGIVHLHLRGSCSGCPSSMMTLKMGIERRLKEEFPEIEAVEAL